MMKGMLMFTSLHVAGSDVLMIHRLQAILYDGPDLEETVNVESDGFAVRVKPSTCIES